MVVYAAARRPWRPHQAGHGPGLEGAASSFEDRLAILGRVPGQGAGAYLSAYLMTDVGQRVVRDIRNQIRHILGQSATFFVAQPVS